MMVGAVGEVQVMDWRCAKVSDRGGGPIGSCTPNVWKGAIPGPPEIRNFPRAIGDFLGQGEQTPGGSRGSPGASGGARSCPFHSSHGPDRPNLPARGGGLRGRPADCPVHRSLRGGGASGAGAPVRRASSPPCRPAEGVDNPPSGSSCGAPDSLGQGPGTVPPRCFSGAP